jgi:hypothetical protein
MPRNRTHDSSVRAGEESSYLRRAATVIGTEAWYRNIILDTMYAYLFPDKIPKKHRNKEKHMTKYLPPAHYFVIPIPT